MRRAIPTALEMLFRQVVRLPFHAGVAVLNLWQLNATPVGRVVGFRDVDDIYPAVKI